MYKRQEYQKAEGFSDLSFNSIVGSGANGAIVHYGTTDSKNPIKAGEMVLVDSGIQCAGGTTDATRTVILGNPEEKQKKNIYPCTSGPYTSGEAGIP